MTLIRKLALSISNRVVRWASPGCKEWAEAQARELAFIPSDWVALRWALGNTRVLLDRREARIGSRSELPARPTYLDVIFWLLYLEGCFWTCAKMLTSTGWPQRLGWGLVLLACGYWGACSVFDWLRERWQPPTSDIQAYRLFLRNGLELRLARFRTVRRWFPALANLAGWAGYGLIVRGGIHFWGYFLGAAWLTLHPIDTPAKIQERVERIDERIAEAARQLTVRRVHSDHWGHPQTPNPDRAKTR